MLCSACTLLAWRALTLRKSSARLALECTQRRHSQTPTTPYTQHPTHNGIDRGLPRMRGSWVEGQEGACVVEALRMESVPANCTPDLLPENDHYVCLQIRGVWSIAMSEVSHVPTSRVTLQPDM